MGKFTREEAKTTEHVTRHKGRSCLRNTPGSPIQNGAILEGFWEQVDPNWDPRISKS